MTTDKNEYSLSPKEAAVVVLYQQTISAVQNQLEGIRMFLISQQELGDGNWQFQDGSKLVRVDPPKQGA
jgi:hypothetical protein